MAKTIPSSCWKSSTSARSSATWPGWTWRTSAAARAGTPCAWRPPAPASPHQIADYVMAAVKAGLDLDHLSEHAVDAALAARSPRACKYLGWPLLLLMRLAPRAPYREGQRRKREPAQEQPTG